MPIFEYKCKKCGQIVAELEQKPQKQLKCKRCGEPMKLRYSTFNTDKSRVQQ